MARFGLSDIDNYGAQDNGEKLNYFKLENDKDVARVRFMYNGADDVEAMSVHNIMVSPNDKYAKPVNCLRAYNEPIQNCPLCEAAQRGDLGDKGYAQAKFFIPLYNEDTKQVEIWNRGKKFSSKLASICSRYKNLVSHTFEIERNGKAGDQTTTYEVYETGNDDTTLEDLPEIPNVLGRAVYNKTADEMNYWLDNGVFPSDNNTDEERPARRSRNDEEAPTRRTPANTDGNRCGRF